jgi:hypothetical protein
VQPGIVAVVVALVALIAILAGVRSARSRGGFERIVRCRQGHLFTTTLVPGASLKAVRLWNVRFQRCPVGRHWSLVKPVDESTIGPDELEAARAIHDVPVP